jgi:hypothetical protein
MRSLVVATLLATPLVASADAVTKSTEPAPPKHLVYIEAFGKGGVYGLGIERAITSRLSIGAAASFFRVRHQDFVTGAPYLHATLLRRGKHALFGELGAVLVYSRIESPVMSWDGASDTGGGGVAGLGWERTGKRVVFRAQGSILAGEGGVAPWGGIAIGFRP